MPRMPHPLSLLPQVFPARVVRYCVLPYGAAALTLTACGPEYYFQYLDRILGVFWVSSHCIRIPITGLPHLCEVVEGIRRVTVY